MSKRKLKVGDVVMIEPDGEIGVIAFDWSENTYYVETLMTLIFGTWTVSEEYHIDSLHYIGKL